MPTTDQPDPLAVLTELERLRQELMATMNDYRERPSESIVAIRLMDASEAFNRAVRNTNFAALREQVQALITAATEVRDALYHPCRSVDSTMACRLNAALKSLTPERPQ